ncbi:hypothetical protein [Sphingomonas sp. URHD0057]|uniref:hypothetical protein n=1 Tax=Sphingomonas sp. URHD0057 TaxID=1380389 RepID=UPI0004911F9A|nr:hypothetical protein [Sphingomonas sp. URHD0057]
MIKRSNLRRPTVPLGGAARPSRIRRDPVPVASPKKKPVQAYPTEREVWTVVIGVVLFALAITVITVGTSNYIN